METELNEHQWSQIIVDQKLTKEIDLSIFQALYSFDNHSAYASQIGLLLGFEGKSPHAPLNLEIGRYAKRIATIYDIQFTERSLKKYRYWDLFFKGWEEGKYFVWQLKPNIVAALENCKLTGEISYAEELILKDSFSLIEGAKKTVTVNAYERNSKARNQCVAHWGYLCSVCNFDFQKIYGNIGINYIHVHHLVPVSEIGKSHQVNPITDLRPVCPNCHSMLHKSNPPLTIEELTELINTRQLDESSDHSN